MRRAASMEFENVPFPKHLRKSLCVVPAARLASSARVEQGWVSFSRAVEQLEPRGLSRAEKGDVSVSLPSDR